MNFVQKKRGDELRKRPECTEKRKARFIPGDGRRPVRNLPMTARENYGYFFPKPDCLLVQNSLDLGRCSAMKAPCTELHRKMRQNAAESGRPEAKNLESIKGRLENL